MVKRGQVTIFIIIAIILVASIAGFFLFRQQLGLEDLLTPEDDSIYLFVESCIEEIGKDAIYHITQNGGYFLPTEFSTSEGIPYYYSNGKNYMPSKEDIEKEISYYINQMLFFCTKNFVDFSNFNITQGEIKTETEIKDEEVVLNVEYPISVSDGKSTTLFEDFKNIEIPVRLGIVYNAIKEIIQEQLNYDSICLSCILDVSLKYDLYVDMFDYDEETVIFIIRDETLKINEEDFEFMFANKYMIK